MKQNDKWYSNELKQDNKWHPAILIHLKSGLYVVPSIEVAKKEISEELAKETVINYQEVRFNWNRGTPLLRRIINHE